MFHVFSAYFGSTTTRCLNASIWKFLFFWLLIFSKSPKKINKKSETGKKGKTPIFPLFYESEPEFEFMESKIREFLFLFLFLFLGLKKKKLSDRWEAGFVGKLETGNLPEEFFFVLIVGGKWNKLWNSGFYKFGGGGGYGKQSWRVCLLVYNFIYIARMKVDLFTIFLVCFMCMYI